MTRPPRFVLLLLVAASLAASLLACAGGGESEAAALEAALAAARAGAAAVGAPPVAPWRAEPAARGHAPETGSAPRAASQLLGARPEAVVAILGEPALRREEGGAAVWRYSSAGCHLDIVLYPNRDGLRVAHVQARAGGIAQRSEAACLRELADRPRRAAPAGPGERQSLAQGAPLSAR